LLNIGNFVVILYLINALSHLIYKQLFTYIEKEKHNRFVTALRSKDPRASYYYVFRNIFPSMTLKGRKKFLAIYVAIK